MAKEAKTYRVIRRAYFGATPGVAANGLTRKAADEYVAAQQGANDGNAYEVEPE